MDVKLNNSKLNVGKANTGTDFDPRCEANKCPWGTRSVQWGVGIIKKNVIGGRRISALGVLAQFKQDVGF